MGAKMKKKMSPDQRRKKIEENYRNEPDSKHQQQVLVSPRHYTIYKHARYNRHSQSEELY